MIDPITDMFNRIRNAGAVFHPTVDVPFSNLKYEIAKILEKEGFVDKVERKGKTEKKLLEIKLKYEKNAATQKPEFAISNIKRISRSGQRIYTRSQDIRTVRSGFGTMIISTSKGLMTNKEARKQKLGGEIICEIW